ncbi:hypothetical protein VTN00DRAFT_8949 [Thermoascus crustaceus]|uniref:uncharacterized protein n=1 Tax=Thermoascus crustaceus TaxID=5088 RepID=UPI003742421A
MAQATLPLHVPQHVSALLSHLTSRPGVQSTLILSRKDGSIIQCTGLLASSQNQSNNTRGTPATAVDTSSVPTTTSSDSPSPANPTSPTPANQAPYKPTQAEAMAAQIHAFVSAASTLGVSLSHPASSTSTENGTGSRSIGVNGAEESISNGGTREEDAEAETHGKEEEDEIKLLRLRTKKHEVVIVPDKKYLLCVIHDALAGGPGGGGGSK